MAWKLNTQSLTSRRTTSRGSIVTNMDRMYIMLAAVCLTVVTGAYTLSAIVRGGPHNASDLQAGDAAGSPLSLAMFGSGPEAERTATIAVNDRTARLPAWVEAIRDTQLFSGSGGGSSVTDVAQWQYFRVQGVEQGRLNVETADGTASGWLNLADIGLSGPPPNWVQIIDPTPLYTSAD